MIYGQIFCNSLCVGGRFVIDIARAIRFAPDCVVSLYSGRAASNTGWLGAESRYAHLFPALTILLIFAANRFTESL